MERKTFLSWIGLLAISTQKPFNTDKPMEPEKLLFTMTERFQTAGSRYCSTITPLLPETMKAPPGWSSILLPTTGQTPGAMAFTLFIITIALRTKF